MSGDAPSGAPDSRPAARAPEIDRRMLEALVCPVTRGPLSFDAEAGELVSAHAGLAYPIRDGIPIMLEGEARRPDGEA